MNAVQAMISTSYFAPTQTKTSSGKQKQNAVWYVSEKTL